MTKKDLFKAAHKLTRVVIREGDDYHITFGACVKRILAAVNARAPEAFIVEADAAMRPMYSKKPGQYLSRLLALHALYAMFKPGWERSAAADYNSYVARVRHHGLGAKLDECLIKYSIPAKI